MSAVDESVRSLFGTGRVTGIAMAGTHLTTIREALAPLRRKIRTRTSLIHTVRLHQRHKRRVVVTNGCYDLLHLGHVTLLARAKRCGDILIVAINSDASTRSLKGRGRPILSQRERALLLAALTCVDYVTVFGERTPQRLIAQLRPDVLIKGADWGAGEIVGRQIVERAGGRVILLPLQQGHSTTHLIRRIRATRTR